ncbi:MAG: threonine ammonia-lyase [Pseudomonadota bacterium]
MITYETLEEARRRLAPVIIRTPLIPAPNLGRLVGADVYLKLENLQRTGSFKFRGAYVKLSRLAETGTGMRVAAASAGNHAQGVALAARLLGLQATIFMPKNASLAKREAAAGYGAEVRLEGDNVEESLAAARALWGDGRFIHPFDDEEIIAGQGSVGLEIMEDLADVEAVVVPVGGGGLLAGTAAAVKAVNPKVKVVGVEPDRAASAAAALARGRPVDIPTRPTLADGTRVARIGDLVLPYLQKFVDQLVQVGEEHIAQAMLLLLERRRVVAEGAGALPLAAFPAGAIPDLVGKKVVLVISGGNVDANLVGRIIDQGLVRSGRIFRCSVILDDRPGALAGLLSEAAELGANVLHIHHDRLGKNLPVSSTRVGLDLETRGFGHIAEIASRLRARGYDVTED